MVDKNTEDSIKSYFLKLKKLIMHGADLNLIKFKLIKKAKIDDILCCIFATLPDKYRQAMKDKKQRLTSMIAYEYLKGHLSKKFFLSSGYYIVKSKETLKYIDAILMTIIKDIQWVEAHEF